MPNIAISDIEEIPNDLMREPLEWFFAEHFRHRQFCRLLDSASRATVLDVETLTRLVHFLRYDMALHFVDEEEDLFPFLRRRALPEDEVEQVLGRLAAEHKADLSGAQAVREVLEACLAAQKAPGLDPTVRRTIQEFASQELQHLALENAVVLPIARLRLTERDLGGMADRLAARRGICPASASG